ncbi:MAG TPA: AI-2E family transporter [Blastocatellia bacterium]|nr:AI-2E family transporter [Blastocatellia bacterium]
MTRDRVLALTLLAATALAFYVCYRLARPFLPAIAWALALAVVAHPLHEWIARRIRHANIAAGLAVLIIAFVIIAPALFLTERLVREAATGVEMLKEEAATGRWRAALEHDSPLAPALDWIKEHVDLQGEAQRAAAWITSRLPSLASGSVRVAIELLITLFILFYFFRDRSAILRALRRLVPLSDAETDEVFSRVSDTVYATIYGTLVVAMAQGALGGLMFWWLGLPAPVVWGMVMALLAIVPVLGAFVVWVPAAILLALEGDWWKAALLTGWGVIVVGLIDNLLYPVLVGKRLRLHTLLVFFAVIGGLSLFGASGVILGPVTLAITAALVDVWRRRAALIGGVDAERT